MAGFGCVLGASEAKSPGSRARHSIVALERVAAVVGELQVGEIVPAAAGPIDSPGSPRCVTNVSAVYAPIIGSGRGKLFV